MTRHCAIALSLLAAGVTPPRAAAQWSLGLDLGASRFSGTARDTSAAGPATAGPGHPTTLALRVDRRSGSAGVGVSVLYASVGVTEENGDFAVVQKDLLTFVEVAPEVSWRFARTDSGAALRLHAGPVADVWHPDGSTSRTLIGARGALSVEWPIAGRLAGSVHAGAVVTGAVFEEDDLPAGFQRRATWRRSASVGLRYRL